MADLRAIQRRLGVPVTGQWDAQTTGAIAAFQLHDKGPYPMQAHGRIDPPTLANLEYFDPKRVARAEGSELGRDAAVVWNQVPRWAWFGLAGIFAWLAYRAWKEKEPS